MRTNAHAVCRCLLLVFLVVSESERLASAWRAGNDGRQWTGTWATAPQPFLPSSLQTFKNQTLRLIVHTSVGGTKARIRISNTYGDRPVHIGAARIARREASANIDPAFDRALTFHGKPSTAVPPRAMAVSDPVDLDVSPLSDLAVSLYFPEVAPATTSHSLALQTNYVSQDGDSTAAVQFPVARTIANWPFLTGVDVETSSRATAIVAFGSSTTDGDGSTEDANRRWPDLLAERLQQGGGALAEIGVLNEGIIGNRLLNDSPRTPDNPFGAALGQAGMVRFDRDVLAQARVKYVILSLGINDIAFPAFSFTPPGETVTTKQIVDGYRELVGRAHKRGIRIVGTTIPPFEHSTFTRPSVSFFTLAREAVREEVNAWIRKSAQFDAVVDFDEALRDPAHPQQLLPAYDAGDHLHVNDAGNVAQANAIPLTLFEGR
jgi:lysophospholipase L1-like esterase